MREKLRGFGEELLDNSMFRINLNDVLTFDVLQQYANCNRLNIYYIFFCIFLSFFQQKTRDHNKKYSFTQWKRYGRATDNFDEFVVLLMARVSIISKLAIFPMTTIHHSTNFGVQNPHQYAIMVIIVWVWWRHIGRLPNLLFNPWKTTKKKLSADTL